MANRDLNFSPDVKNVTPVNPDTSINTVLEGVADLGAKVAQDSANSKVLLGSAQAQVGLKNLDMQFRQQYADDPTNPEGLKDLSSQRQQLVQTIGDNVPLIAQRQFRDKTTELAAASDVSNEAWAFKQQKTNTVSNTNTAMQTYLNAANKDGMAFGSSDTLDTSALTNLISARNNLESFSAPVLGRDKTDALLSNFSTDYVKAFVSGAAENNPQKAAALLNDPNIVAHFTTQERAEMGDLIKRTQKQQQLGQQLQTVTNNAALPDIINDPNSSYLQKRSTIDQMDMQGSISPKAASAARRVIRSSEDLDTQTDTPVMASLINQVYDLNENTTLKQSDYLNGVKSLQEKVLEMQDAGQLTPQDGTKLTKEMATLTQKRVADATKSVGYSFGAANRQFDQLPAEFRGQATRQLFYQSYGQNLSDDQLGASATKIIDGINQQRRTDALSIVSKTTNDDVFLQATGYTRADVAATATKHGLSQDQVIQTLRAKYTKKSARPAQVRGVAPAEDDQYLPPISPRAPALAPSPENDGEQ